MVLPTQPITIPFTNGVDNSQSAKVTPINKLLSLENAVFRLGNTIQKRNGFSALGTGILATSNSITSGKKLTTFNSDLLLLNNTNIYSYTESSDAWIDKGSFATVTVSNYPVIRNSATQTMPDVAYNLGYSVCAWHDSRSSSSLRYSIFDDSSKTLLKSDQIFVSGASVRLPKCLAVEGFLFIFGLDGTSLKLRRINLTDLSETNLTVASDVDATDSIYDAIVYNNRLLVAYNNNAGGITILYVVPDFNGSPVVGSSATAAPNSVSFNSDQGDNCLTLIADSVNGRVYLAYATSGNNVRVRGVRSDLASSTSSVVTVHNIANVAQVTGVIDSSNLCKLFYEVRDTTNPYKTLIYTAGASWDGGASSIVESGAESVFKRSVGLVSKAFKNGSDIYVISSHESTLQPTYFMLDSSGNIAAKILPQIGGGLTKAPTSATAYRTGLNQVTTDSDGNFLAPLLTRTQVRTEAGTTLTQTGVVASTFNFTTPSFSSAQLGLNLHIAGGYLTNYDGVSATEHGFHLFPENITFTPSAAGGSMETGTYRYQIIYEWVDGQGQIHRSSPSVVSSAVSVTGPTGSVSVAIPTLRLTSKTSPRANVKIVVYRSEKTGGTTVLYRAAETDNDPSADTVTIVDTMIDSDLIDNEILYTVGGIVSHDAPPACSIVHVHGNRVWLAGLEEENTIWYSKEFVTNEGLGFSSIFRIRVDPAGGGITALATLDDKLVIFKENGIYILSGDGPLETGQQNNFSKPVKLPSAKVGCQNVDSIVEIDTGIIFKSNQGLKLLTRDLRVIDRLEEGFSGTAVHNYGDLTITSAVVMTDQKEVRFTTRDGRALVYNFYFGQWSTFTNYAAESAVMWDGKYLHLKSNGTVNEESETSYTDNGAAVKLQIETAWIQTAGIQGFQRVLWASVLGEKFSEHVLNMNVYYDFSENESDSAAFNTSTALSSDEMGSDEFGDVIPFGGDGEDVYQFRLKPRYQKCQAIKFKFSDSPLGTTSGQAYSLTALTLEVGVRKGTAKLNSERTGSS